MDESRIYEHSASFVREISEATIRNSTRTSTSTLTILDLLSHFVHGHGGDLLSLLTFVTRWVGSFPVAVPNAISRLEALDSRSVLTPKDSRKSALFALEIDTRALFRVTEDPDCTTTVEALLTSTGGWSMYKSASVCQPFRAADPRMGAIMKGIESVLLQISSEQSEVAEDVVSSIQRVYCVNRPLVSALVLKDLDTDMSTSGNSSSPQHGQEASSARHPTQETVCSVSRTPAAHRFSDRPLSFTSL